MSNNKFKEQRNQSNGKSQNIKVLYGGHTYTIPAQENWTLDALEAISEIEENPLRIIPALKELLGAQYKNFKNRHNNLKGVEGFMKAMQEAMGSAPN